MYCAIFSQTHLVTLFAQTFNTFILVGANKALRKTIREWKKKFNNF
jgi:hypothetical protein